MSVVSDFFLEKSHRFSKFVDPGDKYEAWTIQVDEAGTSTHRLYGPDSLDSQLNRLKLPDTVLPKKSRGSLHLLLHRWIPEKKEERAKVKVGLPFKDFKSFDKMMTGLALPRCYPYDFGQWQHIPCRMDLIGEDGLEIVCHTLKYTHWASLALRYDFTTRTTSCFLTITEGAMEKLLEVVASLKSLASHPLLLPVALYWVGSEMLRRDITKVHTEMNIVQSDTGLLKHYLKVDNTKASTAAERKAVAKSTQPTPTLTGIHQSIVEQHAVLTRGLAEFVEELGQSCLSALDNIEKLGDEGKIPEWLDNDAHLELRKLLTHTEVSMNYELHHREQMFSRVTIQLQVLYNLMQSRIGDETLRDSSAMKSIAVLTMVFLPSTALATIFSMSSFISQSPDNAHIVVSSEFWIFWAIAIPITLLVLICYFLWVQRNELWRGKQDVEAQGGQTSDDGQGETAHVQASPTPAVPRKLHKTQQHT